MVTSVTSLTGNGLRDWLWQRASAIVIALYVIYLGGYYLLHPPFTYLQWHAWFTCPPMQIASSVVLLNIIVHAWIGFWTITTDYLKATSVRISVQMVVIVALLALLAWGLAIFWGT